MQDADNMEDLNPITVMENTPAKVFSHSTGTKIIIRNLKHEFTDSDIDTVHSDLQKLISPFQSMDNFKIEFNNNENIKDGREIIEEIKEKALFSFVVVFRKNEIINFSYKLMTKSSDKIAPREITLVDLGEDFRVFPEDIYSNENASGLDIGEVHFRGYIYEYKLSGALGEHFDNKIKDYLKKNGGIRVYRDAMRVYNYGEEGKDNDILDLDKKRAKKLGDNIGFNQLLASVELVREKSRRLKEKTNREGFIHNKYFDYLRAGLNRSLEIVNLYRRIDKEKLTNAYIGKEYDKGDVSTRVNLIIKEIESFDKVEEKKKRNIIDRLRSFSEEFENIKNIFLTASNTGLNLTFIVHEMDKMLDALEGYIKEKNMEKILKVFNHLKNTVSAYRDTIKLDKRDFRHSLQYIVNQAIFNLDFRFSNHKIEIIKNIEEDKFINVKKNLVIGSIMNIFDNSIWWLDYYKIISKKIYIKIYQVGNDINLVIADNGLGFKISFESAVVPFISGRLSDDSMGIGLHLVDQVMQAHEGVFINSNIENEELPDEFAHGAILKLTFKAES